MPWKFEKQTETEGDSEIERLIGAIEDARFIARMMDRGIPIEELAIRGKLQCAVCKETIENYDDAKRCENKPMHDDCLRCISCKRHLGDFQVKFFKNKAGTLFHCEPCVMDSGERCPYCKDSIEQNQGKLYKGKKYHRRCLELIDVCDECGRSLVESTHMLSLDEPKESEDIEVAETGDQAPTPTPPPTPPPSARGSLTRSSTQPRKEGSPPSPTHVSARPSLGPRKSKKDPKARRSRSSSQHKVTRRSSDKGRKSRAELEEEDEEGHSDEGEHDVDEEEMKNVLTPKKQYCQQCFKHKYDMEICHVCKGPLKKNDGDGDAVVSASSLQKALTITQNQLAVDPKMKPGRKGSPSSPSKMILENAFKFPDGKHPEEFMFEDFICHWECMQCHTCQKSVIGETSFIMAEKHKIWCKFCAEHRFSNQSPTPSHVGTAKSPIGKVSKASVERRRLNNRSSPAGAGSKLNTVGSNIKVGTGPTDIREFKFNTKTTRYEQQEGSSSNQERQARKKSPTRSPTGSLPAGRARQK